MRINGERESILQCSAWILFNCRFQKRLLLLTFGPVFQIQQTAACWGSLWLFVSWPQAGHKTVWLATSMSKRTLTNTDNWETCAQMFSTLEKSSDPAKFKLRYWGATAYLQTGYDDHWIIDTDYDNYAIHYACREVDADGTCLDGYSFIFSRHPTGLRPEDQQIVTSKKRDLCLLGKYRRVTHNGFCEA
uniref:Lipocalin/cytosolic fatty-acid binding domain-containing protein n=1 Tax=Electrophorus electricus TaxID=8005 RepID=A0A4W4GPT3_ELEEL